MFLQCWISQGRIPELPGSPVLLPGLLCRGQGSLCHRPLAGFAVLAARVSLWPSVIKLFLCLRVRDGD